MNELALEKRAPARVGDDVANVDTPALLLDLDAFQANLATVQRMAAAAGLRLRPHGKAHKCPDIARRQVAAGAVGICVQKVSEAEAFVAGGIRDVLVTNEVVGERKLERLAMLARHAHVGVCVDHALQVAQLGAAARRRDVVIDVLVEVDVGQRRCGVATAAQALVLARAVQEFSPHLRMRGLQAYHGGAQHQRTPEARRDTIVAAAQFVNEVQAVLRGAGVPCDVVSGAGTGSFVNEIASGTWTELQPGSYVLMDADYRANQADPREPELAQALFGLCTVISARPGHAVLDGGLKSFAVDSGLPKVLAPGWVVRGLSDEHAVLAAESPDAVALDVGSRVQLVPSHCDPTVNLHDWLVVVRAGRVEEVWPITARGAVF